jgi:hypothetical protein
MVSSPVPPVSGTRRNDPADFAAHREYDKQQPTIDKPDRTLTELTWIWIIIFDPAIILENARRDLERNTVVTPVQRRFVRIPLELHPLKWHNRVESFKQSR